MYMCITYTEYPYIASILSGETVPDLQSEDWELLRCITTEIQDKILVEELILPLVQAGILNQRDREEIMADQRNFGDIKATLTFLDRIPRRRSNWLRQFLDVLHDVGREDVIRVIDPDFRNGAGIVY
jgi:hypothetical protein